MKNTSPGYDYIPGSFFKKCLENDNGIFLDTITFICNSIFQGNIPNEFN